MYKNIKKSIIFFIAGVLCSCGKEDITVQKNDSTKWEIDKKVEDNDIRTQLGYDPRLNYIYLRPTVADLPMLSFGNVTINRNYTKEVEVRLLDKPYDKDIQVSFAYDASAYDKVKANYSGFELGDANLVQLSETTKTLSKGETSVTFTLTISNNSNFKKKVIFSFNFSKIYIIFTPRKLFFIIITFIFSLDNFSIYLFLLIYNRKQYIIYYYLTKKT